MKSRYYYHPDDNADDYRMGDTYKGKAVRKIVAKNKKPRAVEVAFPDGRQTTVHRRSFEVSETAIEFYPKGASIMLKKVGYMADRRVTKWVIMCPLKYDLYSPDGIHELMDTKRQGRVPATRQVEGLSLAERVKRFFREISI